MFRIGVGRLFYSLYSNNNGMYCCTWKVQFQKHIFIISELIFTDCSGWQCSLNGQIGAVLTLCIEDWSTLQIDPSLGFLILSKITTSDLGEGASSRQACSPMRSCFSASLGNEAGELPQHEISLSLSNTGLFGEGSPFFTYEEVSRLCFHNVCGRTPLSLQVAVFNVLQKENPTELAHWALYTVCISLVYVVHESALLSEYGFYPLQSASFPSLSTP